MSKAGAGTSAPHLYPDAQSYPDRDPHGDGNRHPHADLDCH